MVELLTGHSCPRSLCLLYGSWYFDCTLNCVFLLQDHPATGQENLCEVAGYLGRADPWYESNINTLCHMIPKLATMV